MQTATSIPATRFSATLSHREGTSADYVLTVEGYNYSIGRLACRDGKWQTYCGGRRDIAFNDVDLSSPTPEFSTAADALAAFRSRYELAEARAAEIRSAAFALIAGKIPTAIDFEDPTDTDTRIVVQCIRRSDHVAVSFEVTPAEAIAFHERDTRYTDGYIVSVTARTYTSRYEGGRREGYAKWEIRSGQYQIPGVCRSRTGMGGKHLAEDNAEMWAAELRRIGVPAAK